MENESTRKTPLKTSTAAELLNSSYRRPSSSRTICGDRFIPSRSSSNFALFDLPNSNSNPSADDSDSAYASVLKTALFGPECVGASTGFQQATPEKSCNRSNSLRTSPTNCNIFKYKTETRKSLHSLFPVGFDDHLPGVSQSPLKGPRKVPTSPCRVLDAPELQDNFYLNLVDWSPQNVLAVGLGNCVYLWNAFNCEVEKLCDLGLDNSVCSVGWAYHGTYLAVGTDDGKLQLWDASCCKRTRTMGGHGRRIGALAWSSSLLSSGSLDKSILQRDVRAHDDYVSKLSGHRLEVCGLKWSCDNRELASGGNDNKLFIWNHHSDQPLLKFSEHSAAVKAIAWSPHVHGLLASGGGTADQCIRFWNTNTNSQLSHMDTESQVCNLVWLKNVNELVSTHGHPKNQIVVWRYPTMSKVTTLTGHTYRVLYLATSPDGQTIVTGAGDETLRFWNLFPSSKSKNINTRTGEWLNSFPGRTQIR